MNALDPIRILEDTQPPDVTQLTTKSLSGTGVFDILMNSVKLHLVEEWDNNRISNAEYATVYLGALSAVLGQSVNYLMNHQNEKRIAAEIGLIRQQTASELANTADSLPEGLGFNISTEIQGLIKRKLELAAQDILLAESKVLTDKANKDYVGQKIISELAQTDVGITQARLAGYGFNDADTISGISEYALAQAKATADLTEQKVVTELAQTSKTKPNDLGKDSSTTISGVAKAQVDLAESQKAKADAEKIFLAQKTMTELAQTSDTIPLTTEALNTSASVQGSVKKQQDLYSAQISGFARDAEQKLLKIAAEAWNVDATVGAATANATNKLDDASLGSLMTKAREGVGLT